MNYNLYQQDSWMDEPRFHLPPYQVQHLFQGMSETIDWGLQLFKIPEIWKQSQGQDIRIAILDTGIDDRHPDLQNAVIAAQDFTGSNVGPKDLQGHGTHVAGIIAARHNQIGVAGVAPGARLLIGKVLDDQGRGSIRSIVQGIYWAIENKADIISMSLGGPFYSPEIHKALRDAVHAGVFIICAAGNEGDALDTVGFPAFLREAVAVGAIKRNGKVARFSSRGYQVDIMAPGEEIYSTFPANRYAVLSGTSMATPFVTGVVALMLAKHRDLGGETPVRNQIELIQHLRKTALDAGEIGYDPNYGFGLINPEKVLEVQQKAAYGREQWANVPMYQRRSLIDFQPYYAEEPVVPNYLARYQTRVEQPYQVQPVFVY